jgi:hypothetical protein
MRIAFALVALVPLAYRASAQSTLVQPATYRSPSGALELDVDPSTPNGAGAATYRLERDGALVWSASTPSPCSKRSCATMAGSPATR